MSVSLLLVGTLLSVGPNNPCPRDLTPGAVAAPRVCVDSARHTVTLTAGSWDVAPAHGAYSAAHTNHTQPAPLAFTWPVDGWVNGISLRLIGADGNELPRSLLHHLAIINFARRQLLKPTPERLTAFGAETGDMHLPRTVGVPMKAGMPMAIALAWYNQTTEVVTGARVECD